MKWTKMGNLRWIFQSFEPKTDFKMVFVNVCQPFSCRWYNLGFFENESHLMWDMWNYKSSPSTRVGEVQWFKPLLKCVEFYSDELKKWRWISSSIYWNLKARGRLQWNRESRQEIGKWNMHFIQYFCSPIMSHWLTLTRKPYSSMQQCPRRFLP